MWFFFGNGGNMNYKEKKEFSQKMNYVTIRDFLKDNFEVYFLTKQNKQGRNWRIKHSEIAWMPLVIPINFNFSDRNQELVAQGKIVIVQDEYGKFQTYIAPRVLFELMKEDEYLEDLKEASKPFYDVTELEERYNRKEVLRKKLMEIEEIKRIAKCFNGSDTLKYIESLKNAKESCYERRIIYGKY